MKQIWITLSISTLILSGCMYGPATAPVDNRNIYSGNVGLNTPSAARNQLPVAQPVYQPVYSQSQLGQPVYQTPQAVTPYGQHPNPTLAQQASTAVGNVQVQQQSPYTYHTQTSAPPVSQVAGNDGWNIRPDAVQGASVAAVEGTNAGAATPSKPEPVRPPQRQQEGDTQTAQVAASGQSVAAAATPQTTTVAAAPRPQESTGAKETAVTSLLRKASDSLGKGDLDGAVGYLENAQRIEPRNSKILYDIANIRYHQGNHSEAEAFASRAVRAGGSNAMLRKSWSLIANSRKALGDNQGAIAAAEKAASY